MAYTITTPLAGFQGIALTDTTQNHALGTIVQATDPTYGAGEFIYLKGIASTVVGSMVDEPPTMEIALGSGSPSVPEPSPCGIGKRWG